MVLFLTVVMVFFMVQRFLVYIVQVKAAQMREEFTKDKKIITSSQSRGVFIGKKIFVWFKFAPPCIV